MNETTSRPGDAWLEAACSVLLVALPTALAPTADFFFEGAKALLARALGLGLLALLAGRLLAAWRTRRSPADVEPAASRRLVTAALGAALLLAAVTGLSTLLALHRDYALQGSPARGGGWLTTLAALTVFVAVVLAGRGAAARERLVTALVLGAWPPVLLALLQLGGGAHFGISAQEAGGRVGAAFGNPIFLGSYLILVLPPTLWLAATHARRNERRSAAILALLALLELVALWGSGSRGPLLAALGGLGFALPLLLLRAGRARWAGRLARLGLLGLLAGLTGFHLLFVLPARGRALPPPLARLTRVPTVLVRIHIYRTITAVMLDRRPLERADGAAVDPHAALRPWIGYGPQNLGWVTDRHFPPELERLERTRARIDAAHNGLLEIWLESGLLGLAAWLLPLALLLVLLPRAFGLGDLARPRNVARWLALGVAASVALAAVWGLWAWPIGFVAGLAAGLLLTVLRAAARPPLPSPAAPGDILGVALALAMVSHLLDAQASVTTVTGSVLFAALAALLVRAVAEGQSASAPPSVAAASLPPPRAVWGVPLLTLLAAFNLHASLALNRSLSASPGTLFVDAWRTGLAPLGLAVCLAGALVSGMRRRPFGALLAGWLGMLALWSVWLAWLFGARLTEVESVLRFSGRLAVGDGLRELVLALGALLLGVGLLPARPPRRWAWVAGLPLLAAVLALQLWPRSGRQAAMSEATAGFLEAEGREDLAVACLSRALGRGPWDDRLLLRCHLLLARQAQAQRTISPPRFDELMHQAAGALQRAQQAAPFDARLAERRGLLGLAWAAGLPDAAGRLVRGSEAVRWLTRAYALTPGRSSVGLAAVHAVMTFASDTPRAEALLRAILECDPANARAGELLATLCQYRADSLPGNQAAARAANRQEARLWARRALESSGCATEVQDRPRLERIAREQP